jgi:hypothetical protein
VTGRMLHVADGQDPEHQCAPPGRAFGLVRTADHSPVIAADVPAGSVWRCDCGQLWRAERFLRDGVSVVWREAGLITAWRYRKAGRTTQDEDTADREARKDTDGSRTIGGSA